MREKNQNKLAQQTGKPLPRSTIYEKPKMIVAGFFEKDVICASPVQESGGDTYVKDYDSWEL